MNNKLNAYLIMAHNEPKILKKLITLLDDSESDIYIHWDKSSKDIDKFKLKKCAKFSNIYFVKPIHVTWGGYSQIKCELILLSEAVKRNYCYYHLLSGVDLPLKTPVQINGFLKANMGKQFIWISKPIENRDFYDRVEYYYFFQDILGRNYGKIYTALKIIENFSLSIQKKLKVNRIKKIDFELKKGNSWFSITHNLAEYILSKKKFIKKYFKFSNCADEIFLPTIAYMSPFKKDIINNSLRCIDWKRGTPYTYTLEDYEMLISSEAFFARKFSLNTDRNIVDKIYKYILEKK